jgi:hypothetical protein
MLITIVGLIRSIFICTRRSVPPARIFARAPCSLNSATASSSVAGSR